jgi:hypothetical protein
MLHQFTSNSFIIKWLAGKLGLRYKYEVSIDYETDLFLTNRESKTPSSFVEALRIDIEAGE